MTALAKRTILTGAVAVAVVLASASIAFAAPVIPRGDGWNAYHGSYPGYCLNCHSGFAASAGTITSGATPTHGDRGATCTQCHTVTTPAPVDTVAPATTSNAVASYTSSASIRLTATDAGSGVAATHFVLDGGADTVGASVSTSVLGSHRLEFWSIDKAGNVESRKTVTFTVVAPDPVPVPVDTVAPVTTSNAVATYTVSATVRLTATDSGSGIAATHYVLDGGADMVGTAASTSATGTHVLEFWSVDKAGNVEARKAVTFTVAEQVVSQPPVVQPGDDDHDDRDDRGDREDRRDRDNWRRRHDGDRYRTWADWMERYRSMRDDD